MTRDSAEALALQGLTFLANDGERLDRFVALAGLSPANLRAAAAEPGFFAAVLDHIAGDERLVLAFADAIGCDPAAVGSARAILNPGMADG